MSKVAHYLQEHLMGEVMYSPDALKYFSTDGSAFSISPTTIVYPHNENDVRKVSRFTWQLAERGRVVPITARGSGTDTTGAAIGSGIIMVFTAHMNRIVEIDNKNGMVTIEPGINYGKLQQTLMTHGLFIPSAPASMEYSTVGGAIANNSSGEYTLKYGDTASYTKSLRVVLANGEVIETGLLTKRELNKKLGLSTFEGEIYRGVDSLLEENHKTVEEIKRNVSRNSAGYNLMDVKNKQGFDLTPLFTGSQGTLGIITEATLDTETHNPMTTLLCGMFDDAERVQQAVIALRQLADTPCSIEMVDENLLRSIEQINPNQLKDVIAKPYPKFVLLVEFDDPERKQKHAARKAFKVLEKYGANAQTAADDNEKDRLNKLKRAVSSLITYTDGHVRAVPVTNDGIVPLDGLSDYLDGIYKILKDNHLQAAVWGHVGDANLQVQPHLDLSQVGDRQTFFKLMDDYYNLVIKLGGSISAEYSDGRLRAPYLPKLYGDEVYSLMKRVKEIFDPYGTLNPGVKIDVTIADIKPLLRQEYTLGPWYNHLPRG